MVYRRKSHLEMDDDWGYPYISGNHHFMEVNGIIEHVHSAVLWCFDGDFSWEIRGILMENGI